MMIIVFNFATANELRPELPASNLISLAQDMNEVLNGEISRSISQQLECDLCQANPDTNEGRNFKVSVKLNYVTNHDRHGVSYEEKKFKPGRENKLFRQLYTSSQGNRDQIYRAIKNEVGCGEGLMNFMGKVGNSFINIYDTGRSRQAANAEGMEGCEDMFQALNDRLTGSNSDARSGVCRDHAICLARIAARICPEVSQNICALTYSTPGNYHATLVAKTQGKIHHLSYDIKRSTNLQGPQGTRPVRESSVAHRVWCGDGRGNMPLAQQIPSELGIVLNEVMGGNNSQDFDPQTKRVVSMVRAQISSMSEETQANIFFAKLSNGDEVVGTANSVAWYPNFSFLRGDRLEIGLTLDGLLGTSVGYKTLVDRSHADRKIINQDQIFIALNLKQQLTIPFNVNLSIGKISGKISGGIHLLGTGTRILNERRVKSTGKSKVQTHTVINLSNFIDLQEEAQGFQGRWSGDGLLNGNLNFRLGYETRRYEAILTGRRQYIPGLEDVRTLEFKDVRPAVNFDHVQIEQNYLINNDLKLTTSLDYQVNGHEDTAILRRSIGGRIGIIDRAGSFNIGLRRSLQGQPNFNFLPGGSAPFQAEVGVTRRFRLTDNMDLETSIETQVDVLGNHRSFFNLDLSSSH